MRYSIAFMVYGESNSSRNALLEEKYRDLAIAFRDKGLDVNSVIYNDTIAEKLYHELQRFDAILVWVNPIEQGKDRKILDKLLTDLSTKGCFVSAHPDTILKIGTKEILYKTRDMAFGGDIKIYHSFDDFKKRFLPTSGLPGIRILKQYRGNGGNGVFKIDTGNVEKNKIRITHAIKSGTEEIMDMDDFLEVFKNYFSNNSIFIDQPWNPNIINGMVRCYLCGPKVAGFGYQEVNALYPSMGTPAKVKLPGKRYYFSEDCGLFQDLRVIMENNWVPSIQELLAIKTEMLPVIWDADFFINKINNENTNEKYSLCEINASSVSPFPESAIPFIVDGLVKRLDSKIQWT